MLRRHCLILMVFSVLSLSSGLCYATQILPSPLDYMVDFCDTIVIGHVLEKHSYWEGNQIYTDITLETEDFLKNDNNEGAAPIKLKIPGGKVGDITAEVDEAPIFTLGEKVLLFLRKFDEAYFPYGFYFGVFQIYLGEDQTTEWINGPLLQKPVTYHPITKQAAPNPGPLGETELVVFLERVRKLVRQ